MSRIIAMMQHLSGDDRRTLLLALLAQEVCQLPVGDRDDEVGEIVAEFPSIYRSTEEGMRNALVENARRGV